ncbi:hypothetical protein E6C27_scaffold2484G00690 [Cucumis melo var. makuwa]|uniref:Uncharacterized protein n=1 Tax=Cucumis melo var. makuwa TaxID=1194695 RepID=A0A5A7VMS1_CUCMM|nr:hypothetical protein E6C27_scaffold2484G00690 [Cucumis melo var. makuwa]
MRLEERLLAKGGQGREAIGREGEKERLLAKRGKAERPLKKEDEVESLEEDMRLWEAKKDRRRRRYLGFRLFVISTGSKYRFTPETTSCSLRPTDPLLNNWFKVQPINLNPSRTNEKVGSLVQDLDSVLKGTTYLLSQKWVVVNFILHPMFLAIHSILSLKWEAYCASDVKLSSPMQI